MFSMVASELKSLSARFGPRTQLALKVIVALTPGGNAGLSVISAVLEYLEDNDDNARLEKLERKMTVLGASTDSVSAVVRQLNHPQMAEILQEMAGLEGGEAEMKAFFSRRLAENAALKKTVSTLFELPSSQKLPEGVVRLKAGDVIGSRRWSLISKLGEGGMGLVWRVKNGRGRVGALKVMQPNLRSIREFTDRFEHEMSTLEQLSHPNLVRMLDWGLDPMPYLVTEFIDGDSLDEALKKHPSGMPLSTVIPLFSKVAEGLAACHDADVLHRDIKPENILIRRNGSPVIIDFGIAKKLGDAGLTQLRSPYTMMFAAQEQVRGLPVSKATDVYGLAATLLYTVSHHNPGLWSPEIAMEDAQAELQPFLKRCLAANPRRRSSAMAEVSEMLGAISYSKSERLAESSPVPERAETPQNSDSAPAKAAPPATVARPAPAPVRPPEASPTRERTEAAPVKDTAAPDSPSEGVAPRPEESAPVVSRAAAAAVGEAPSKPVGRFRRFVTHPFVKTGCGCYIFFLIIVACTGMIGECSNSNDRDGEEFADGTPANRALPKNTPHLADYDYIGCWLDGLAWGMHAGNGHLGAHTDDPETTIQGPDRRYGPYPNGTNGMFFDGSFSACLANGMQFMVEERIDGTISQWDESFWMTALAVWSGVPLRNPNHAPDDAEDYIHVNPEFAIWMQGMVPANDGSHRWHDQTLQEIYDIGFSRYLHLMTEARVSIAHTGNTEEHVQALLVEGTISREILQPLATTTGLYEEDAVRLEFGDLGDLLHPTYASTPDVWILSPWQAASFWLRRQNDGSIDAVWGVFLLILDRFDPAWQTHLKQQYPEAQVWEVPQTEPLDLSELTVVETDIGDDSILYIDGIVRPNHHPAAVVTAGTHEIHINTGLIRAKTPAGAGPECHQQTITFEPQNDVISEDEIVEFGVIVACP